MSNKLLTVRARMAKMPRMINDDIPVSYLHALFEADFKRGWLFRRTRPEEHFALRRIAHAMNARDAGKLAGSVNSEGYRRLRFMYEGRKINTSAHRVLWAMAHGAWPAHTIDHKNGRSDDNRLVNLREALREEQSLNAKQRKSTSGLRGVYCRPSRTGGTRISAAIRHLGVLRHLGDFETAEQAHRAYLAARAELNTFQPVPRGRD